MKSFFRPLWNSPIVYRVRGVLFDVCEVLTGYSVEKKRFESKVGYVPNIQHPRSFSEHIVYKKLYDRNPLLAVVSDKYAVRGYIKKILGEEESSKVLIPLLYATSDLQTIPFDTLSGEYIIKANHNSGPHFIVEKNQIPDREHIISSLEKQIAIPYGILKHEWAYKKIKNKMVVVERLLRDEDGNIPKDYKFHMVKGQCVFIQVDFDRFSNHSRTLYDKDWNYLPVTLKFPQGPEKERPENLDKMLKLATLLSAGFDYIRIDLYTIKEDVYFGEMTHYPGSGMEKFTPEEFDFTLGTYW
ncbi:MAG: ATP-grasp fold amidoligase family protein [Candidatus Zambryskibacteria bacterium]|nr:ATP-grasp fold amidoligase family protein [Candidatus Zambryskibacteria bacterium]